MENTMNNRNEIPQQVKQVVSIAETLLQGQILGMYLYGSATMNKLRPDSDIDILITDYPFMHLLYSQLLVCQRVCLQNTVCLICK